MQIDRLTLIFTQLCKPFFMFIDINDKSGLVSVADVTLYCDNCHNSVLLPPIIRFDNCVLACPEIKG